MHAKKISALILMTLSGAVCAQGQFENDEVFAPVVGRWKTSEAKFTSQTNEEAYVKRATSWTGKMFGMVKPNGNVLFKAENGCILSGVAAPFASAGLWSVEGQLEKCKVKHFNQKVFGNIRREGNDLVMDIANLPFSVGRPPVGYYLRTRMSMY